jgi:LPS sulfotransferase NodH
LLRLVGPKVRFVIIAVPRSGSTLLTSLLDAHPDVRCDVEILRLRKPRVNARRFVQGRAVGVRLRKGVHAYGFKAVVEQLSALPAAQRNSLVRDLQRRGFHIVVLRRRDLLARAVSAAEGRQSGKWHFRVGTNVPRGATTVDPDHVLEFLERGDRDLEFLDAAVDGVPHVALTYEDDLESSDAQEATLRRLCAEFGLPAASAKPNYVRGGASSLRDRIANYDDVMDAVRQSRFAAYADPVPATSPDGAEQQQPPGDG